MDDLISRQAAIDAIRKHELVDLDEKRRWYNHGLMDAEIAILDVPSAQPEGKTYEDGWKDGREALRREVWENGRDRLD